MIEYEYKHYKELSSNHSWTFNDFSDTTINKLNSELISVIFAHIDDSVSTQILIGFMKSKELLCLIIYLNIQNQ